MLIRALNLHHSYLKLQLVIWGTDNAAPDTMRAVVTAAIPGIGAIGAILAYVDMTFFSSRTVAHISIIRPFSIKNVFTPYSVWTYAPGDAPDYRKGNLANLSSDVAIFAIVVLTALYIRWENGRRDKGDRDHRAQGKTETELRNLGYRHPQFRYQI